MDSQMQPNTIPPPDISSTRWSEKVFPFESLPAELRLKIYEEAFKGCTVFEHVLSAYQAPDSEDDEREKASKAAVKNHPRIHPLLQVNRVIRNEAFASYFQCNEWHLVADRLPRKAFVNFVDAIAPPKSGRRAQLMKETQSVQIKLLKLNRSVIGPKEHSFAIPAALMLESCRIDLVFDTDSIEYESIQELLQLMRQAQGILNCHVGRKRKYYKNAAVLDKLNDEARSTSVDQCHVQFLQPHEMYYPGRSEGSSAVSVHLTFGHAPQAHQSETAVQCRVMLTPTKDRGLAWNATIEFEADFITYLRRRERRCRRDPIISPGSCCANGKYWSLETSNLSKPKPVAKCGRSSITRSSTTSSRTTKSSHD